MKLSEYTFDQLVDEGARRAMDNLLTDGGKGLKGAIWMYMNTAIQWRIEKDKEERAAAKKKKARA